MGWVQGSGSAWPWPGGSSDGSVSLWADSQAALANSLTDVATAPTDIKKWKHIKKATLKMEQVGSDSNFPLQFFTQFKASVGPRIRDRE